MAVQPDIAEVVKLYLEADRSGVRERYESILGPELDADSPDVLDAEDVPQDESAATAEQPSIVASLDAEFEKINNEWPVPVRDLMQSRWSILDEVSKVVALHYLWNLLDLHEGRYRYTCEHIQEGLLNTFGVSAASHFLHSIDRGHGFPIGEELTNVSFDRFRRILQLFEIDFDCSGELPDAKIWWNISDALDAFAEMHGLDPWQLWAVIYDLGPRLLRKPGAYPTEGLRVWLVATNEAFGQFHEIDGHGTENVGSWAIHPEARRGDIALMYCTKPRSAITAVYRCATDAHFDPFGGWNDHRAEITDCVHLDPWITLSEMKKDPVLKAWKLVQSNMQGTLRHEIPENVWRRILELVSARDARAGEFLQQYAHAAKACAESSCAANGGAKWSSRNRSSFRCWRNSAGSRDQLCSGRWKCRSRSVLAGPSE